MANDVLPSSGDNCSMLPAISITPPEIRCEFEVEQITKSPEILICPLALVIFKVPSESPYV